MGFAGADLRVGSELGFSSGIATASMLWFSRFDA
jgi:hypothetical protein